MKIIRVATSGTLNGHWQSLFTSQSNIWFLSDRENRSAVEKKDDRNHFTDWASWSFQILKSAGCNPPELLKDEQQKALIRIALSDPRCLAWDELKTAKQFPGLVDRLIYRLNTTPHLPWLPEEIESWRDEDSFSVFQMVYQNVLEKAHATDEMGMIGFMIAHLALESVQQEIGNWYQEITSLLGSQPHLIIPRADRLDSVVNLLAFSISDLIPNMEVGICCDLVSSDNSLLDNESVLRQIESWTALGAEIDTNLSDVYKDLPENLIFSGASLEKTTVKAIRVAKQSEEMPCILEGLLQKIDAGHAGDVEIYSELGRNELDSLIEQGEWLGLRFKGVKRPLIQSPEVRSLLDIGSAMGRNWPAESLVDLLRNPDFQQSAFATKLTQMEIFRLASDIVRLGNVNDIATIRELLTEKWYEKSQLLKTESDSGISQYQLVAGEFLKELEAILSLPETHRPWQEHASWFHSTIERLIKPRQSEPMAAFWDMIGKFGHFENLCAELDWNWQDFLAECQLQANQMFMDSGCDTDPDHVRIQVGRIPEVSLSPHWFFAGFVEGTFPAKRRISAGLKKTQGLDRLRDSELRIFRGLCGLAVHSLQISYSKHNSEGVETDSAGFLRAISWQDVCPSEWILRKLEEARKSQANHTFFTRSVTMSRERSNGDSRYLGELKSKGSLQILSNRFHSNYGFSPTALESASLCPFQFFGKQVLRIAEDESEEDLATDFRMEGTVIHEVLEKLHTLYPDLKNYHPHDLSLKIPELIRESHAASDKIRQSPLARGRWQVEHRRIELRLQAYVSQLDQYLKADFARPDEEYRVIGPEVMTQTAKKSIEPLSLRDPDTDQQIRIHGRIDRVDGATKGSEARVRVIDYKTGGKISSEKIKNKIHLQLPLYSLMLQGMTYRGFRLSVVDAGFWYLKKTLNGYKSITNHIFGKNGVFDIEVIRKDYTIFVAQLVRSIREGRFRIAPREPKCDQNCALSEVCRISEIRNQRMFRQTHLVKRSNILAGESNRSTENTERTETVEVSQPKKPNLDPEQQHAVDTRGVSVVLTAGAGCGKTGTIIQKLISLMQSGQNLGRVAVLTFTTKAAAELRHRVRIACETMAQESLNEDCAELDWSLIAFAIDGMTISTYHSFYEQICREFADIAEIDPDFRLLEERLADGLKRKSAEEAVRNRLEIQDETLIEFAARHRLDGLVDEILKLMPVYEDAKIEMISEMDPESLAEEWRMKAAELQQNYRKFLTLALEKLLNQDRNALTEGYREKLSEVDQLLLESPELQTSDLLKLKDLIFNSNKPRKQPWKDLLSPLEEILKTDALNYLTADDDLLIQAMTETQLLASLTIEAKTIYDEMKKQRNALDFDDLVHYAECIAGSSHKLGGNLATRFDIFLVDEFQDTDSRQVRILKKLCGQQYHQGELFIVGDIKQSIYRFRGAKPQEMLNLLEEMPSEGRQRLVRNYRSRSQVLNFVNELAFELYSKEEGLLVGLSHPEANDRERPGVEFLWTEPVSNSDTEEPQEKRPNEDVHQEAEILAKKVREMLESGFQIGSRSGKMRSATPGDFAMISRRRTHWRIYERAFRSEGLQVYLGNVGQLFQKQEIRDLVNLLSLVENPMDDIRLAAVLRGPFCSVPDEVLFTLSVLADRGSFAEAFWQENSSRENPVDPYHHSALEELKSLLTRLQQAKLYMSPSKVVRMAIREVGYDEILRELSFQDLSALANLEKLVEDARAFDYDPGFGYSAMIRQWHLDALSNSQIDEAVTEPPKGCISFLTVHAAKGLQFPVVILTGSNGIENSRDHNHIIHPEMGLVTRSRTKDSDESDNSPDHIAWLLAKKHAKQENDQELDNLLYVALTRAEDFILISAPVKREKKTNQINATGEFLKRLERAFDLETGRARRNGSEQNQRLANVVFVTSGS